GGLERDAVHGPDGVGIRPEARGDPRDGLAVANDVDRGIDRRNHERLPWAKLRRVFDPIVVRERLRRDRVDGRYREERLSWCHGMYLESRRIHAEGGDRRAPRDDHGTFDTRDRGSRHEWRRRLRERERSEPLELGRGGHDPDRDDSRDDTA